ncbi:TetR/AcrR family transcriptional regulator [Halopseudomonas sp.]|uniref:TetR/AcrR family transcriptional regulator n=1 Tax=Halopseudomonas sp. TaxID=2901191 RepID=UPI00300174D4
MAAAAKHRNSIITSAIRLFRQRGYAATGLNDILKHSGAPKGSLYHYFPGGKEQLGEEAIVVAAGVVTQTLTDLRAQHPSAADMLRAYGQLLAGWMTQAGFAEGCPIATTLLETTPQSPSLAAAGQQAFASWCEVFAAQLQDDGVAAEQAQRWAQLMVSTVEGALLMARVQATALPITQACDDLAALIDRR